MEQPSVASILSRWPSLRAVHDDMPPGSVSISAVEKWPQRGTIPLRHWSSLIAGAKRRGIRLTFDELLAANTRRETAA